MGYTTEKEMMGAFKEFLIMNNFIDKFYLIEELNGLFGIPDLILIEKTTSDIFTSIAIELKLSNWKRAVKQAFKYKSFSNVSFVVMDANNIELPKNNIEVFINSNIGLASFDKSMELKIHYSPRYDVPYSEQLMIKLDTLIQNKELNENNIDVNKFSFESNVNNTITIEDFWEREAINQAD